MWKSIELSFLQKFHPDVKILWKSHAPEKNVSHLKNIQLADLIRFWYIFRVTAAEDLGIAIHEMNSQKCTCIGFNRNIRSKSKQYFFL